MKAAADVSQLDIDETPTAKTCPECKGSGQWVRETRSTYAGGVCSFCDGKGRIPVSGTIPAVLDPSRVTS